MLLFFSCVKVFNSTGLAFDIVGAALVFFNSPEMQSEIFTYNHSETEELERKDKKHINLARVGFAFLGFGFLLQLISNFL